MYGWNEKGFTTKIFPIIFFLFRDEEKEEEKKRERKFVFVKNHS